jgi:hypothetical protein
MYIGTHLQPPLEVSFNIHSFGDDRKNIAPNELDKWIKNDGIDAFIEYNLTGYIVSAELLADKKCDVAVNSLGSLDWIENRTKGIIGEGWFEADRFHMGIWLPHYAADAFLNHLTTPSRRYTPQKTATEMLLKWQKTRDSWQGDENRVDLLNLFERPMTGSDNAAFINVRFDIFDLRPIDRMNHTAYSICRMYA